MDWILEAQLATAEGHPDQALAAIDRIPGDHPIAAQALLLAGRIERQQNRLTKAESAFRRAIAVKPGLVEAHKELIYILGIQSRRREVDAEFQALARLTPLTHHDLFTWSLTHFTQWSPDIVEDLEGFIRSDPEDRYSRLAWSSSCWNGPERRRRSRGSSSRCPTPILTLALRTNLAFNLGQFDKVDNLLASAPTDHPRIARIRGEIALRQRDLDGAIRHFQQALSAEPYDRVSPMQLAQVRSGSRENEWPRTPISTASDRSTVCTT